MTLYLQRALIAAAFLTLPLAAFAADFRSGDNPSTGRGEVINDDLYIAGGSVSSSGSVLGDLIAGGGTVIVDGPIAGDAMAAGGTVMLSGEVADDARLTGGTVVVSGPVAGDALIAGGQLTLSGQWIGGDAMLAGGTIRIDAPIAGDAKIAGGEVYLNAPVGGTVSIQAEKITLGPKANIAGDLWYSAPTKAILEAGAAVGGVTQFEERSDRMDAEKGIKAGLVALFTLWLFAKFLMLFIGALALSLLLTRYVHTIVTNVVAQPFSELGRGAVAFIVIPVASIALLFTIVGIPFGVLGFLAYMALLIFSALLMPIVIGSIVHKWVWKPAGYEVNWKTILLGTVAYFALHLIPFIGWLVSCGVFLAVLGVVVGAKWRALKEWR